MEVYAQLLGAPKVRLAGVWHDPSFTKANALLYYLAIRGEWCSRDELLLLFYPDTLESIARNNLRQRLTAVRRLSYSEGLEIEATRLRWPIATDVHAFKRAVQDNNHVDAVELYQGRLLEGCSLPDAPEFESWLEAEREELYSQWRDTVLALAKELEGSGRHLQAGEVLEKLYKTDPLDEEVLRQYLQALGSGGQRSRAIDVFERFEKQLQEEYGGEPEAETLQLVGRIEQNDQAPPFHSVAAPSPRTPEDKQPRHNLPIQPTPFVGREAEKEKVSQLLQDPSCPLLTVVGPGGMGKTRLALELAREQLDTFKDGVFFVNMVPVASPELMVYAIGQAIGFSFFGPQEPKEQLLDYLKHKEMLLVLDNLEHLLSGVGLVSKLLKHAPHLKLLATSRERLNLQAEWVFDLYGLSAPEREEQDASEHDAVKLFVQRAASVRADFSLHSTTLPIVIRICELVRGLPLAIELAASWLRALPVEAIASEIEQGISFLEASTRDLPERHRSIRAVFDHSWRLLTVVEQAVLKKLSVCQGGFRREAATDIAGANLLMLSSLVDKSFLTLTPTGRYRRHPLVIQYTQEKLSEHPEERAQAEEKHGHYYLRLVQEREADLRTRKRKATLAALEEELPNIRIAWTWTIKNERVAEIRAYASALGNAYENRRSEGVRLFAQAVTALDERNPTHHAALGHVLIQKAWFLLWLTRNEEAKACIQRGLELLEPLDEVRGTIKGMSSLGWSTWFSGDFGKARTTLKEGLVLAKDHGRENDINDFMVPLGLVEREFGSFSQVRHFYQQALAEIEASDDLVTKVFLLHVFGAYLVHHHHFQEGLLLLQESLLLTRELDFHVNEPFILLDLAMTLFKLGDYDGAEAWTLEALSVAGALASRFAEARTLAQLGRIATARGDYAQAQHQVRLSLQLSWIDAAMFGVLGALLCLSELNTARGDVVEAAEWLGLVRQQKELMHEQKLELEHLLEILQEQLSPQELEEALERGKRMNLEEVVQGLLATL